MQSNLVDIIRQLQSLIKQTQNIEALYVQEIVALQKIKNNTYKSVMQIQKQNLKNDKKGEKKEEVEVINVEQKVNQLIRQIQNKQNNIENNVKTVEVKKQQIVIEKKPPIPVVNKTNKTYKNSIPTYVPPRNPNQITQKVTQTVLRTSAQKVFKPQKNTIKKSQSIDKVKQKDTKSSIEKANGIKTVQRISYKDPKSMQKQVAKFQALKNQQKSQISTSKTQISTSKSQAKHIISTQTKKKQSQQLKQNIKIVNFTKPFQQILQSLIGNNKATHKPQLLKLIHQYQTQQKGYKLHEQTNRKNLIKKINNYSLSKHNVNTSTTHTITRKKWIYSHQLFIYDQLLHNLDTQISNLQLLKDCRIDPKQQYRLKKSLEIYNKRIEQIIEQSKSYPDKIDINFQYTPINSTTNQINNQTKFQNINEIKVHQQLLSVLEQLIDKGSLQKKDMRCLQVLSQISIFKSKRCPNIIMVNDYQQWKQYYNQ